MPKMSWPGEPQLENILDHFHSELEKQKQKTPQIWAIEYDLGISFLYNDSRLALVERHGHVTEILCKQSKVELAKELRELALACNEAATHLEKG